LLVQPQRPDCLINVAIDQKTQPLSDLFITKSNGVQSVRPGEQTTYTIRVTNDGPEPVTPVLSDPFVAGLTKGTLQCSSTPGKCTTPPTVAQLESETSPFQLPTLNASGFYEITFTANVNATGTTVANQAWTAPGSGTINSGVGCNSATGLDPSVTRVYDPSTGRCTVTDTDTIAGQVTVEKELVAESNTPQNKIAEPAEELTYEVRIRHQGGGAISDFDFVEFIPDGTTRTAVTGASGFTTPVRGPAPVKLTVNQVPIGETATVTIKLLTAANFPLGVTEIKNRVGGGGVPADCSQCEVTLPTPPSEPTFPPTLSCTTSGNFFNTAYDGAGGRKMSGTDLYWGVAMKEEEINGPPPTDLVYSAASVYTDSALQNPPGAAGWIALTSMTYMSGISMRSINTNSTSIRP